MGFERKRFVRNAADKTGGVRFSLVSAFTAASNGLMYAVKTQRNMKIHLLAAVFAIMCGCVFAIDASQWAAIIICMVLVFAFECMNTALESVVDLVSPEYADLAKHAKDCAAAAVFVCAVGSLVVAAVIFGSVIGVWLGLW